jgi:hypothetical protein
MRSVQVVAALLVIAVAGCSRAPDDVAVTGQIFIVTQGRENVRLGLVTVALLAESTAQRHVAFVDQRMAGMMQRWQKEKRSLQASSDSAVAFQLTGAQKRVAEAEIATAAAERALNAAIAALTREWDEYHKGNYPKPMSYLQELAQARDRADVTRTKRQGELQRANEALAALRGRRSPEPQRPTLDPTEVYLMDLPPVLARAQTDADGEFSIKVPREGKFVLVARAERQVLGQNERYLWMVRMPEEAKAGTKVLMSNETMATGGSPLSLVHISE